MSHKNMPTNACQSPGPEQADFEKSAPHPQRILASVVDYAIFTLDSAGLVTSWNEGAERAFGYASAEILGRDGGVLWTPEDRASGAPAQEMETARRTGAAEDKRWHLRKDGSRFFANGMLRPIDDESGNFCGFTKVCRDATAEHEDRKALNHARAQVAASLELERARLLEIFQRSPSFIAVLNGPDHVFELANAQYYQLVGQREIIAKPVREALPDLVGQGFFELLDRVYATGEPFVGKGMKIILRADAGDPAKERFVDFVFQPRRGLDGASTGIFVHGVDVTEREASQLISQRLAAIVDSSDDAIVAKDLRGIVTSWNAGAERIFGYSASEMIGVSIKRLIPPHRPAREEEDILARITRGERVDHMETERITKDGRLLNVSVTVSPIKDATGKIVGASKVARDITDRRHAEEKLRASEQRFRQLWTTTADGIVIMDAQQHVEYVNPAVERIFGFAPEEVMAKGMSILVPERLRAAHRHGMQRFLESGVRKLDWRSTEIAALHRDGHEFPIEISFSHFQENNRELFAAFIRDITERKEAQQALQESEARFRQLADSMPNIVWAARPDGLVDYHNWRWFEFTGLPEAPDEEAWRQILHPADVEKTRALWLRSVQTGEPYETEFRYRRASDGEYRWHLGRALPVQDAAGNVLRWFGTSTDIHDQKLLQEQNEKLLDSERAARAEAEHASRMKDEFLATLSHELRTPLNAIMGWSQILRDSAAPEDLPQGLEIIERNARAQTKIIDDLLDMSRIISGKVRIDVQRLDLAPIVEAAVESIRPAANAKGVRLQAVLDPLAGPASGDPNRLQQVFWNLLSNAVKFTPRDGRVQVLLQRVNSHLEVVVSDTGEGIRPEFLPHVFDRFRQADATTTRRHGGLGLGLAIVKQLVELHGGTVQIKSEGRGTTVIVALPLTIICSESLCETGQRHPTEGSIPLDLNACQKLDGVKVLVVDDERDARELVRRLLEDCHALVRTAATAAEAFSMLESEVPDVLVSDVGMPVEDGYSLIRRIRALTANQGGKVPAVALTAYARAEDRMRAVRAGFQMHIAKPVEPAELLTMVASLAGRTRAE